MPSFSRFFPRRELNIALALSCLLHLAVLFPLRLDWQTPAPLPQPMRLNAALTPAPTAPLPASPAPPAPVAPVETPSVPSGQTAATSSLIEAPTAPEADAPLPEDAASNLSPVPEVQDDLPPGEGNIDFFPARGEIRYTVYRGTQGFEVGRAELRWEIAEGRYRLASLLQTTGLAALFHPVSISSESVGNISARGLQPEHYQQTRNKDAPERVEFDHAARRVRIQMNPPVEMNANSHDFLSLQYQFAYNALPGSITAGTRGTLDFWLATRKKYEFIRFVILGEETLELPAGSFNTLHVQSADETSTDIWLAQDYLMLPVRLHFTDKNGDHYEQAAREILIEEDEKAQEQETEDKE
ncbi:MAG: DUF3108 domain-containing protein [Zoogloeaceae bacterium]|jgi:hypothetical protein|nr:DUF3108 domain-containing protein [Zoogloeaceae bacterium]